MLADIHSARTGRPDWSQAYADAGMLFASRMFERRRQRQRCLACIPYTTHFVETRSDGCL